MTSPLRFAAGALRLLLALGLWFSCGCAKKADPEPPMRLDLQLYKKRWKPAEYLWYRVQLTNLTSHPIDLFDEYWIDPQLLTENSRERTGTYLVIIDAQGREVDVEADANLQKLWSYDLAGCPAASVQRFTKAEELLIRAGKYWPGWLAPRVYDWLRESLGKNTGKGVMEFQPGQSLSPCPIRLRQTAQAQWNSGVGIDRVMGRGFKPDAGDIAYLPSNQGYRVLGDYKWVMRPGKYCLKAVLDERAPLPSVSAEEELDRVRHKYPGEAQTALGERLNGDIAEDWKKKTPEELTQLRRQRAQVEGDNAGLHRYESPCVDFEVAP